MSSPRGPAGRASGGTRRRAPHALRALLLLLAAYAAAAKRSPACPGGCIIATSASPRQCACVQERCSRASAAPAAAAILSLSASAAPAAAAAAAAAAPFAASVASQGAPPWAAAAARGSVVPARAAIPDACGFCSSDFNTYASIDECMAAEADFLPAGAGLSGGDYPQLAEAQTAAISAAAAALKRPPGGASGNVSAATGGPAVAEAVSAAACPWPIVPQSSDGVARASCPYDATANTGLAKWETLFPGVGPTSDVTLPVSTRVVISGCALGGALSVRSITVPAGSALIIADQPLALSFRNLFVSGTLSIGAPGCPIASPIVVTVPGGNETFGVDALKGSTVDIHGTVLGPTWTRLAATVTAGSNVMTLRDAVRWAPGESVVLVSTLWKDELLNQNEVLTVKSVSPDGQTVTVNEVIKFNHYGGEYQAEVALLSRRILFTSDDASPATTLGPHTTFFTNDARVVGAAYERWGARNKPGKYSLHFHLAGEAPNSYLRNNAVYNSNWRCITIHGTNAVTLYGNVGFNVHGHCYYLEDGVEERNVLERNLAAYVHPIYTAGSGGGQQGTDRWANATLFDPSDSGASGFYTLNAHNSWIGNAAAGGFAGFTFPTAPRAIKEHKDMLKPDGFPFNPSERPLVAFRGNSAHSSGYNWEHGACVYFGGFLLYRKGPGGVPTLFYNNGRGKIQGDYLCPDPNWPASDSKNANNDCWVGSARGTMSEDGTQEAFLRVEDLTTALCNVGINSWGDRIEVTRMSGYDLTRGSQFLGQSWLSDSVFQVNTSNSVSGWSQWPWTRWDRFWESPPIKGFEWYDTFTTTILSNVTFKGYKYRPTSSDPNDWWYMQTPAVFRMLSHSDVFKPDKTMMATKGIVVEGADLGTCTAAGCVGNSLFRVDRQYTGSAWQFNWEDADGSVVRAANPSKPPGRYLIGSFVDWWDLDPSCWRENNLSGVWVCPIIPGRVAARLDMSVRSADGSQYFTSPYDWSVSDPTRIGYASLFRGTDHFIPVTRTEGTTGVTGNGGWYVVYNGTATSFQAPKRLMIYPLNLPRETNIYWTSCWPNGTTFSIKRTFEWAHCMDVTLTQVPTRDALMRSSNGSAYWVDANNCLHLKLTDPGQPWVYSKSFQRAGLYVEELVRWFDHKYDIVASGPAMSCASTFFCPLPGDPASRLPPEITSPPAPDCGDVKPPDALCPSVKCGWDYWPGCSHASIVSGGYCRSICNACPAAAPPPPPGVSLAPAAVALPEGNSGTTAVGITVILSSSSPTPVTVAYATADVTAAAGSDYTAASGTLSFAPDETRKNVTVYVIGDTAIEANETFRVTLSNPSGAKLGSPTTATVTILNDDTQAVVPGVAFASEAVSVAEGNAGSAPLTLTVRLTAPAASTVNVSYSTAPGNATAGLDYTSVAGSLSFAPGESSKDITVPILGDQIVEGPEVFTVALSGPTGARLGAPAKVTVTIVDDDAAPAPPTVAFQSANYSVFEGNTSATPLNLIIRLSAPVASNVTVTYATASGTATAGTDFVPISGTVNFAPREVYKAVTLNILGDTTVETDESLTVTLTGVTGGGGVKLGSPAAAVVTIKNDDSSLGVAGSVLTRLNVTTGTTACPAGTAATPLKAAGWVAGGRAVAVCTASGQLPAAGSGGVYVSDVTVSARSWVGTSQPTGIACPTGYALATPGIDDGAGAWNGQVTAANLCVKLSPGGSPDDPVIGVKNAASAGGCAAADGWRPARYASTSGVGPGLVADLNAGTGAAPLFLCLRPRTPPVML